VTNYSLEVSLLCTLVTVSLATRHFRAISPDSPIVTIAIFVCRSFYSLRRSARDLAARSARDLGRAVQITRDERPHTTHPNVRRIQRGWIYFESGEAGSIKGKVELEAVLRGLVKQPLELACRPRTKVSTSAAKRVRFGFSAIVVAQPALPHEPRAGATPISGDDIGETRIHSAKTVHTAGRCRSPHAPSAHRPGLPRRI
jgi:hypothetical protein